MYVLIMFYLSYYESIIHGNDLCLSVCRSEHETSVTFYCLSWRYSWGGNGNTWFAYLSYLCWFRFPAKHTFEDHRIWYVFLIMPIQLKNTTLQNVNKKWLLAYSFLMRWSKVLLKGLYQIVSTQLFFLSLR